MDRIRKQDWQVTFPELSILNIPQFRVVNFTGDLQTEEYENFRFK